MRDGIWAAASKRSPGSERDVVGSIGWSGGGVFDKGTCRVAARGGLLGVLKWLRELECPWDERTCWGAASYGWREVHI